MFHLLHSSSVCITYVYPIRMSTTVVNDMHQPGLGLDELEQLEHPGYTSQEVMLLETNRDLKRKLEESDAALDQSLCGASSSAEHSQQQQQQGMSSYQAHFSMQELVFFRPLQG
ncbi:hypothetical protein IGI04_000304, partial [Brassica rapa subsp. trilocularis]